MSYTTKFLLSLVLCAFTVIGASAQQTYKPGDHILADPTGIGNWKPATVLWPKLELNQIWVRWDDNGNIPGDLASVQPKDIKGLAPGPRPGNWLKYDDWWAKHYGIPDRDVIMKAAGVSATPAQTPPPAAKTQPQPVSAPPPQSKQPPMDPASRPAAKKAAPLKAQANVVAGRVTMADGSPIRGKIKEISIGLQGVTQVGKTTSYSPIVRNGAYSQKVPYGFFSFSTYSSYVTLLYNNLEFKLYLEPVGNLWNKSRESTRGIVQDFVLKHQGPTPTGIAKGQDIGNTEHWYGQSISILSASYREDTKQSQPAIPAGTRLVFTLTPTRPAIDGRTIQPFKIERIYKDRISSLDLTSLMPALYQLSGVAVLPDGTTKRIVLQARGDYPKFKPVVNIPCEPAEYVYSVQTQIVNIALEG